MYNIDKLKNETAENLLRFLFKIFEKKEASLAECKEKIESGRIYVSKALYNGIRSVNKTISKFYLLSSNDSNEIEVVYHKGIPEKRFEKTIKGINLALFFIFKKFYELCPSYDKEFLDKELILFFDLRPESDERGFASIIDTGLFDFKN